MSAEPSDLPARDAAPTAPAPVRGLIPFALVGVLAAAVGFLPDPESRVYWFAAWAVPILWLAIGVVVVLALAVYRGSRLRREPTGWPDIAAVLALVVVCAGLVLLAPARARVQLDEAQIAGSAFGVFLQRTPVVVSTGLYRPDGTLEPGVIDVDKRGALLPTLIGTLQAGNFDAGRGFALNLAFGWLALVGFYALLRRFWPPAAALAAVLCFCANPAFAWSVRSLGLEPLNLALLVAFAILVVDVLRTSNPNQALLLAWLGPLMAQARYEAVLASMAGLAVALLAFRHARPGRGARFALALVPLGYLPLAWQRAKPYDFGLELIGEDHAFGFDFLVRHVGAAARFFATATDLNPAGAVPLVLACAGLALVLMPRTRPATSHPDRIGIALLIATVAAMMIVVFALAWGNLSFPTNLRHALPLMLLLAVAAVLPLRWLRQRGWMPQGAELLAAGALFLYTVPGIAADSVSYRMISGPALTRASDWLRSVSAGCEVVVVSTYAPYFVPLGYSALTPGEVDRDWAKLRARAAAGEVGVVLALQVYDMRKRTLLPHNEIAWRFAQRELLVETLSPQVAVRIAAIEDPEAPLGARPSACAIAPRWGIVRLPPEP